MEILDAFECLRVATGDRVYLIVGKITSKNRVLWGFQLLGQKYATGCFKMQFWSWKQKEHIRNDLNLTGFAPKPHPYYQIAIFWQNSFFWDFQLPFPAENEKENSSFWNLKIWKKCKILTFQKSCLKSFWWCFSANPLVWG